MATSDFRHPPVLVYHSLALATDADGGVGRFERQMAYLARRGNRTLTPSEFITAITTGTWPRGSVFITVDDGYRDFYEIGFPVLQRYGLSATVFLITDVLEQGLDAWVGPHPASTPTPMGWAEVKAMLGKGVFFGSHGVTHRRMTSVSAEDAAEEAVRSKQVLEAGLGEPVELFAYPYGSCCEVAKEAVREAGYVAAMGLSPVAPDELDVPRREIITNQPVAKFGLRLSGAFPALHKLSRLVKAGTTDDDDDCE